MRIGYGKIGRSLPLAKSNWGFAGGDDEPPLILDLLARRHPDDEFILFSRNSGEKPEEVGMPANVTNVWADLKMPRMPKTDFVAWYDEHILPVCRDVDGMVLWTGQHGTSNTPIPQVGFGWEAVTKPQDAFLAYASLVVRGVNAFRAADPLTREEVWLCPDPRNYVKARDLKWPNRNPTIGQYDWERIHKHERYGDTRSPSECGFPDGEWEGDHVWTHPQYFTYSRLEISGVMPHMIDSRFIPNWEERKRFGLFIGEARAYVKWNRLDAMRDWVIPCEPDWVHGKWTAKSLNELGMNIEPAPWETYYDILRSVKCTFTTPSSGSGWATTKPWQAFAVGTVCFFHPQYDTQDNVFRGADPKLKDWLRVESPQELKARIDHLETDRDTWLWLVHEQRAHYDRACEEMQFVKEIEERIWK